MRCLYCGKGLALFKRLRGGGEFCSDAHRQQYQEQYNELALNRLLQAKPPEEEARKPEQTPALLVEQKPVPAPAQGKSQNGHKVPASGAPGRATPETRVPAGSPTPAARPLAPAASSGPAPAAATLTGTHATAIMDRLEPARAPEPPAPDVKAPAPAASFVTELPGVQNAITPPLVFPELELCAVVRPEIVRHEVTLLLEHAATVGANGPCHAERLPLMAAPCVDFRTGLRGRGPEMRAPVRAEPVATFALSPLGGEEYGRPDEPLAFSIPAWPPEDTAVAWQENAREFLPLAPELGDLGRLAFAAAGFDPGAVVAPTAETEETTVGLAEPPEPPAVLTEAQEPTVALSKTPEAVVLAAPDEPYWDEPRRDEPRWDQRRGSEQSASEQPANEPPANEQSTSERLDDQRTGNEPLGAEPAGNELAGDAMPQPVQDLEPERAPATPMWFAPQEHQPAFLRASIEPVRIEPVHIDPLFLQALRDWTPLTEPEVAAEPAPAATIETVTEAQIPEPGLFAESGAAAEPVAARPIEESAPVATPNFAPPEAESHLAVPEPHFEGAAEAVSAVPQGDAPSASDTPQAQDPSPEAEPHFFAPEAVMQPLPVVLHGLSAGRGRPVQVFTAGLAPTAGVQIPRTSALPLRPLMVLGPAPVIPETAPEAAPSVASPAITPATPVDKPAQTPTSGKPPASAKTNAPETKTSEPAKESRTGKTQSGAAESKGGRPPVKPDPKPEVKSPEAKSPEVTSKVRAEVKPEVRPEVRTEVKPVKPEAKSEAKPEIKPEAKPDAKLEAKLEAKREPKPEAKLEPKRETKSEAKPETRPAKKTDAAIDPGAAANSAAANSAAANSAKDAASEAASPLPKPLNPPITDVDLGLPSLVLDGPQSSKMPATPVMIALAAALIVVIGGAVYLMSSGKGKSAPVTPDATVTDVVEAGAPLSIADGGWIDDWAPQPPNPKVLRVLSIMRGSLPLSDYRMEFEAQIESKALGWVFRALDPKDYYVTKLEIVKPGIEPVVEVVHFAMIDGQEIQPRTRVPLPLKVRVDTSYKVRFEALGDRFTTYVQDQEVDEWSDSRIAKGGVGMYRERDESAPLKGSVRLVLIARKKP